LRLAIILLEYFKVSGSRNVTLASGGVIIY
jgi:hypothetical protein